MSQGSGYKKQKIEKNQRKLNESCQVNSVMEILLLSVSTVNSVM